MLIITALIVFITDLSGARTLPKRLFCNWLYIPYRDFAWETINPFLKILDCSLCQTWWVNLIYIIEAQHFTLPYIGLCAVFAFLTPIVKDIMVLTKDCLGRLVEKCSEWLNL